MYLLRMNISYYLRLHSENFVRPLSIRSSCTVVFTCIILLRGNAVFLYDLTLDNICCMFLFKFITHYLQFGRKWITERLQLFLMNFFRRLQLAAEYCPNDKSNGCIRILSHQYNVKAREKKSTNCTDEELKTNDRLLSLPNSLLGVFLFIKNFRNRHRRRIVEV